jgi:hypothetical protein
VKKKMTMAHKDAQRMIGDLRMLYPKRAETLMMEFAAANVEAKILPPWRQKQLESFITVLTLSAMDLERAHKEKRISTLAWVTRNLLELSIWVDYCNLSDANAKRFSDDAMQDLHGLAMAIQRSVEDEVGNKDKRLEQKLTDLEKLAQSKGVQRLNDGFKAVADAAKDLGRHSEYRGMNKLLSKFAHPTAWSIHTVASVAADEDFRRMFLRDGVTLAMNALIAIRTFIRRYYPQVAMTARESKS